MKKLIVSFVGIALLLTGCETKTGTGTLMGSALGAGIGGIAGGGRGALIGGAVGAFSGGIMGAALDEQDRRIMERSSPITVERMDRREPLTINDIIRLSQGGVSDDTIIRYINMTRANYSLNQEQIKRMQDAGVSQRVINYMVNTDF